MEPNQECQRLQQTSWNHAEGLSSILTIPIRKILSGNRSDKVIKKLLRAKKQLTKEQRAIVAEILFSIAIWRRRLAYHLRLSPWQLINTAPPEQVLFALFRNLGACSFSLSASLAGLSTQKSFLENPNPPKPFADRFSLPDLLAKHFQKELGTQAESFAAFINTPGPIFGRANLLKTSRKQLCQTLLQEGVSSCLTQVAPAGIRFLAKRVNIYGLLSHQRGEFEVQDEASQLIAALVEAKPGEIVIDYCAGAGGKTLALAADLQNQGELHVYDPDQERLLRLKHRAIRAGVTCHVIHTTPTTLTRVADSVLVDAPCSELGTLRRSPDLRFGIDQTFFATIPEKQKEILNSASRYVRVGGRLIYATCTLRQEENQEVANSFLKENPSFEQVQPGANWLPSIFLTKGFFYTQPHIHKTDGFFAAVFRKFR